MKDRKAEILEIGLVLWRQDQQSVSARNIGKVIGITHAAVLYHWQSIGNLKAAIADLAVVRGDAVVVPQLIVARHPAAASLSKDQRSAFLARMD